MTSIFKQEDQIPAEYRIEEINQQIYLLNGECVKWNGPTTVIYSPVCIPGPKGLSRKIVGTVPESHEENLVGLFFIPVMYATTQPVIN